VSVRKENSTGNVTDRFKCHQSAGREQGQKKNRSPSNCNKTVADGALEGNFFGRDSYWRRANKWGGGKCQNN